MLNERNIDTHKYPTPSQSDSCEKAYSLKRITCMKFMYSHTLVRRPVCVLSMEIVCRKVEPEITHSIAFNVLMIAFYVIKSILGNYSCTSRITLTRYMIHP